MKLFLIILLLQNVTLILAQEYDCGENYNHIRIGVDVMLTEQFKPIKGYEGLYEISNFGRIKSLSRQMSNGIGFFQSKERILKLNPNSNGYYVSVLCKNRVQKTISAHVLVWDHFSEFSRDGHKLEVDHIDADKSNNRIDNLQLLTNRKNKSKYHKSRTDKTLKFVGVSWDKDANKWRASIYINKKIKYLGLYNYESDAAKAYSNELQNV